LGRQVVDKGIEWQDFPDESFEREAPELVPAMGDDELGKRSRTSSTPC
jgi:hypothetical protein